MTFPIPVPKPNDLINWAIDHPDAVVTAIQFLNSLYAARIQVTAPSGKGQGETLMVSDSNIVLPIPLQLPNRWSAPTGSASRATFDANEVTSISNPPTQAQVSAVQQRLVQTRQILAALILDLQNTGQMPT